MSTPRTCAGYFTNHDGRRAPCRNAQHGHSEPAVRTDYDVRRTASTRAAIYRLLTTGVRAGLVNPPRLFPRYDPKASTHDA